MSSDSLIAINVGGYFFYLILKEGLKMGLKSKFKTNSEAANKGVDFKIMEAVNKDGSIPTFTLTRRSMQNKEYVKKVLSINDEILKEYGVKDAKDLTPEQNVEIDIKTFCKTLVVGWANIQLEDDGVNLEFNYENAFKLLSNPDWYDLYKRLDEEVSKRENFSAGLMEKMSGN